VDEMLADKSSPELTRLAVYEDMYGPLDGSYERARLADIQDLMNVLIDVTLRAAGNKKGHKWEPVYRPGDTQRERLNPKTGRRNGQATGVDLARDIRSRAQQ
jgi:hypothetical protein